MTLERVEVSSGLRERKRAATEARLRRTALRLFKEHGYAAVSIDAIAAEADVSRSTFFRLFGSKEAVLFAEMDHSGQVFLAALRERPDSESPWKAFEEALLATAQAARERTGADDQRTASELINSDPSLIEKRLKEVARWSELIAQVFAERGGREAPSLEDRLAASTCMAISEQISGVWRNDPEADAAAVIREAFGLIRSL